MRWLVTGGAGYIGSHVAHALGASGREVVVLDDLSTGSPGRLPAGVTLVVASVLDTATVREVLTSERIGGVIHLAGKKSVTESLLHPAYYYRQNIGGLSGLLAAMGDAGVHRLVFSSSAAVYTGANVPVDERCATVPSNPYGWTKLAGEQLIRRAGHRDGLGWMALRYFNVAGAGAPGLGDTTMSNLLPTVFSAIEAGRLPRIFGGDHPTRDGSCIRDYVHVADVAEAHLAAAAHLECTGARSSTVYNIGRGIGVSVREILASVRHTTGHPCGSEVVARRQGDPAILVADVSAIAAALGWHARRDLTEMIRSAWAGWCVENSTGDHRETLPQASNDLHRGQRGRPECQP